MNASQSRGSVQEALGGEDESDGEDRNVLGIDGKKGEGSKALGGEDEGEDRNDNAQGGDETELLQRLLKEIARTEKESGAEIEPGRTEGLTELLQDVLESPETSRRLTEVANLLALLQANREAGATEAGKVDQGGDKPEEAETDETGDFVDRLFGGTASVDTLLNLVGSVSAGRRSQRATSESQEASATRGRPAGNDIGSFVIDFPAAERLLTMGLEDQFPSMGQIAAFPSVDQFLLGSPAGPISLDGFTASFPAFGSGLPLG